MITNNSALPGEGLVSVREAARLLHVSPSTVWRWVSRRLVPAYRIGPKRVWLKTADLEALVVPARALPAESRHHATQAPTRARPSAAEIARRLAAVEAARRFQAKLLAERGGRLFDDSAELLHEIRSESTMREHDAKTRSSRPLRLTAQEAERALGAMKVVTEARVALLKVRGGKLFDSSAELLRSERTTRSKQLR